MTFPDILVITLHSSLLTPFLNLPLLLLTEVTPFTQDQISCPLLFLSLLLLPPPPLAPFTFLASEAPTGTGCVIRALSLLPLLCYVRIQGCHLQRKEMSL